MNDRNRLGSIGERVANDFLARKGYQILAQNWRFGRLELDLVALEANILVIVEVKTRAGENGCRPELAVNRVKQQHLAKAARAFLSQYSLRRQTRDASALLPLEVRFDIVAIRKENNKWLIHHLEDAFFPQY